MRRFIYSPKFVSACIIGSFVPAIRLWKMYKEKQVGQTFVLSLGDSNGVHGSVSKIVELSKNSRGIVFEENILFCSKRSFPGTIQL